MKALKPAVLAAAIAAIATLGAATAHAQVVLKVHHFLPSTSSAQVKLIQPWCDKIAKESGARAD